MIALIKEVGGFLVEYPCGSSYQLGPVDELSVKSKSELDNDASQKTAVGCEYSTCRREPSS